jgi:hypothetical protein
MAKRLLLVTRPVNLLLWYTPGGAFVASRLLLIRRVAGPGEPFVAHALRTLPQKGDKWMVKGWNNAFLGAPDGEEINFLEYMHFEGGKWKKPKGSKEPPEPCTYEIKLVTAKDVPK